MLINGIYVLNENPKIVSLSSKKGSIDTILKDKTRPLYCLVHQPWYTGKLHRMIRIKNELNKLANSGIKPYFIISSG